MSMSELSAPSVGGVQFAANVSESVPLAVYLKMVHCPMPPAPVPSPQFASLSIVGAGITNVTACPVAVGRLIDGGESEPVSPGAQKSPVCGRVGVDGSLTISPGTYVTTMPP